MKMSAVCAYASTVCDQCLFRTSRVFCLDNYRCKGTECFIRNVFVNNLIVFPYISRPFHLPYLYFWERCRYGLDNKTAWETDKSLLPFVFFSLTLSSLRIWLSQISRLTSNVCVSLQKAKTIISTEHNIICRLDISNFLPSASAFREIPPFPVFEQSFAHFALGQKT